MFYQQDSERELLKLCVVSADDVSGDFRVNSGHPAPEAEVRFQGDHPPVGGGRRKLPVARAWAAPAENSSKYNCSDSKIVLAS